ncbi:hypothetical protein TB2_046000 [Malus domestica]
MKTETATVILMSVSMTSFGICSWVCNGVNDGSSWVHQQVGLGLQQSSPPWEILACLGSGQDQCRLLKHGCLGWICNWACW